MRPTASDKLWYFMGQTNGGGDEHRVEHLAAVGFGLRIRSYEGWTKDELSEELEKRGLPKSGNKDELIARLQEDDNG